MKIIRYSDSADKAHWRGRIGQSNWRAGAFLAGMLESGTIGETLGDGAEVLLLTEGDELIAYCTYAPLDDIQPTILTPWAGFVYTFPAHRGHRHAGKLLSEAARLARSEGFDKLYLSTEHAGLYEKYGFVFRTILNDIDGKPSRIYEKDTGGGEEKKGRR